MLYATTGDAGNEVSSRSAASLAGKILRMTREGGVPQSNPFGSHIWSLGHRNPQGMAWDGQGRMWSTEHGRSGIDSGLDEVNLVAAGGDYGWPAYEGDAVGDGITPPVLHSGASHTWAPSGAAWLDGRLYFGGLRGQALFEVRGLGGEPELVVHFFTELGRIRQVRVGPDGMLYILTANRDGRGQPRRGDDRLVRVDPRRLGGG
jgi:glucose/arabinose dehydrogenase